MQALSYNVNGVRVIVGEGLRRSVGYDFERREPFIHAGSLEDAGELFAEAAEVGKVAEASRKDADRKAREILEGIRRASGGRDS